MASGRRSGLLGQHPMNINDGTFAPTESARPGLLGSNVGDQFDYWGHHAAESEAMINWATGSTVWKPTAHDALIDYAFRPHLNDAERDRIKKGSHSVDMQYGVLPVTLIIKNAYKHAMTPCGLSKEKAIKRAHGWIIDRWQEARRLQAEYEKSSSYKPQNPFSLDALYAFGEGAHTYMDNTSPMHTYFQEYCYPDYPEVIGSDAPPIAGGGLIDNVLEGIQFVCEMIAHGEGETEEKITEHAFQVTTEILHIYFQHTFGEVGLQIATGKLKRTAKPPGPIPSPHPTPPPKLKE